MDLSNTVDKRINQLIEQDKSVNGTLQLLNSSTIGIIEKYLTEFFNRYAQDNHLDTSQANAMVNNWDKQQLQQLLNTIDISDLSDDAQQRIKVQGVKAGISHGATLNAIIGISVIYLADKQVDLIMSHETNTVKNQIQHLAKISPKLKNIYHATFAKLNNARNDGINKIRDAIGLNGKHYKTGHMIDKKLVSKLTEDDTVKMWSDNLWNKSDEMANNLENLVNQHIRHGMTLQDLHDMLASHNDFKQFKPNQSLADMVKQSEFNARRIIRTETSHLVNTVNKTTYSLSGVKTVGIHHEPDACDKCIELAESGPWDISDAPDIPYDTHPNCYCYLTSEDDDSDDLTVNPNTYNK